MALVIKHNRANHTHENEQFRQVAISLKLLFESQKWDGLLIGNPFNELYSRFRADAILFYNHGLLIIDFKVYNGTLRLPPNKGDFEMTQWYTESDLDKKRILVKAGSKFINPYKQLYSYRETFKEIVKNEIGLFGRINETKTCALNIFSGPLEIINSVPKEFPFYKITQEANLGTLLYDYASENKFTNDISDTLSKLFRAEEWIEHIEMQTPARQEERVLRIDNEVESAISDFLKTTDSGILVLESMAVSDRDSWVQHILAEAATFNIPQIETWIHSARIGRRVSKRIGFELQSLYNTIYGSQVRNVEEDSTEENDTSDSEQLQEIVGIRSDDSLDESAVIILHEAHLVSRSLHQSEFLRFGTGRLLEDLFSFLNLKETKRKLICIGDPYSLTYGKDTDSSLNVSLLTELFNGSISYYKKVPDGFLQGGRNELRQNIASSIDSSRFNRLTYPWKADDLIEITKAGVTDFLRQWFSKVFNSEPSNTVLVYTNKDAKTINDWIKSNCIRNGVKLACGDLILVNNNINIPDETGFGQPTKLYNGMYLQVEEVLESHHELIKIKQVSVPINLSFTKVKVKCLSLPNHLTSNIWLLNNYMESDEKLSKNEQIALRVYVNNLIRTELKNQSFENSNDYEQLKQNEEYIKIITEEKELKILFDKGEKVKTEYETKGIQKRKIEAKYKKRYRNRLLSTISKRHPLVNAAFPSFGWAITVHKSVGNTFSNVILNAFQGETRGIANADYFRWLYTGISSASGTIHVANPQLIYPLMNIHFEDVSIPSASTTIPRKPSLSFPSYKPIPKYSTVIPQGINEHVSGGICELSSLLQQLGYNLHAVRKHGDYLTKATYTTSAPATKSLVLAFNNKGVKDNWELSSIRIENSGGENEKTIQSSIDKLFETPVNDKETSFLVFPEDFRGEVYKRWANILSTKGYTLRLLEVHNNQDVLSIQSSNSQASFRMWYGKEGFFSQFVMLSKSEENLGVNLKNWLLDGN